MVSFNYENWKKLKPTVEQRDGFGMVQAWTCEYYQALMRDLEERYRLLLGVPEKNDYIRAKIDLLADILFNSRGDEK